MTAYACGRFRTVHTDLGIDDLALAGPGIGSAAYSYHSRVGS